MRVAAINTVGDFVMFLGKLAVVVATIFIGIEIVDLRSQEDGKVNHVWAPVALAAIFAYLTASCFIGVYEVSSFYLFLQIVFMCILHNAANNLITSKEGFIHSSLIIRRIMHERKLDKLGNHVY